MPQFTVQSIIDRAAAQADMQDNFVKPSEWLAWFNFELSDLDIFMAKSGWTQNLNWFSNVAPSGIPNGTLGIDEVLAVAAVYEYKDGQYRRLVRKPVIDFPRALSGVLAPLETGEQTGPALAYSVIVDSNTDPSLYSTVIQLSPIPTSGTYVVAFLGARGQFSAVNSLTLPLGVEERIVLKLARRARIKEESDFRDIDQLIKDAETFIESMCWSSSLGEAPAVRNVDFTERGWTDSIVYPNWAQWAWI